MAGSASPERIARLRAEVQTGTYRMPSGEQIADAMLARAKGPRGSAMIKRRGPTPHDGFIAVPSAADPSRSTLGDLEYWNDDLRSLIRPLHPHRQGEAGGTRHGPQVGAQAQEAGEGAACLPDAISWAAEIARGSITHEEEQTMPARVTEEKQEQIAAALRGGRSAGWIKTNLRVGSSLVAAIRQELQDAGDVLPKPPRPANTPRVYDRDAIRAGLLAGKTYTQITATTGASDPVIAEVSRALKAEGLLPEKRPRPGHAPPATPQIVGPCSAEPVVEAVATAPDIPTIDFGTEDAVAMVRRLRDRGVEAEQLPASLTPAERVARIVSDLEELRSHYEFRSASVSLLLAGMRGLA